MAWTREAQASSVAPCLLPERTREEERIERIENSRRKTRATLKEEGRKRETEGNRTHGRREDERDRERRRGRERERERKR